MHGPPSHIYPAADEKKIPFLAWYDEVRTMHKRLKDLGYETRNGSHLNLCVDSVMDAMYVLESALVLLENGGLEANR